MADFCGPCIVLIDCASTDELVIYQDNILIGGDIDIQNVFEKYILPNIEDFLKNKNWANNVGGICEHCGLLRLSIENSSDMKLIAHCYKNKNKESPVEYKIASIDFNYKLIPNMEEIVRMYNEN